MKSVGVRLEDIEAQLNALGEYALRPKGTIRIASTDHAVDTLVWRRLTRVLADNHYRMVILGSPTYFAHAPRPRKTEDLLNHNCAALRFASGGMHAWELRKGKHATQVRAEGQLIRNGGSQLLNGALSGCGLACVPDYLAVSHVAAGCDESRGSSAWLCGVPQYFGIEYRHRTGRHPGRPLYRHS